MAAAFIGGKVHRSSRRVWRGLDENVAGEGRDGNTIFEHYAQAVEGDQVCWGLSSDYAKAPGGCPKS